MSWEIDEKGRRFRKVGRGCIEYMPVLVTTTSGSKGLSEEQFEALRRKNAEIAEKNAEIVGTKGITEADLCRLFNPYLKGWR